MSASAAAAPPLPLWKGAWGGAWVVVYGCLALLARFTALAVLEFEIRILRLAGDACRVGAAKNDDADLARRVADFFGRGPAAFGGSERLLTGVAILVALLVIGAGIGVLRRSEFARRAAILLVALSLAGAVAIAIHSVVTVLPLAETWSADGREILNLVERTVPDDAREPLGFLRALLDVTAVQIGVKGALVLVHALIAIPILIRLCGAPARAWCGDDRTPAG